MAKRAKFDQSSNMVDADRLSDLPDDILHQIISFLPSKYAFRTSTLSKRWRSLVTSIPNLILDEDNIKNRKVIGETFMNFVDKLMQSRGRSTINRFQLKCGPAVEPARTRWWITHATFLGIKEINLEINNKKFENLPVGLFACRTLTVLKLRIHQSLVLKVPEDAFLPSLKQLSLHGIAFSDESSLQRMFSCCPLIQQATLHICELKSFRKFNLSSISLKGLDLGLYVGSINDGTEPFEFMIDAPNLALLKYCDYIGQQIFKPMKLPSLRQACLDFLGHHHGSGNITHLLKSTSNVGSLHLSGNSMRSIREYGASVPLFPNLTSLRLHACEFPDCMKNLPELLANSPVLRTLVFEELAITRSKEDVIFEPPEEVPCCLMNCLKTITLLSFRGTTADMKMVAYFLRHSKVLQSLSIHLNEKKKNNSQIPTCLLKFARASMFCQVVIK